MILEAIPGPGFVGILQEKGGGFRRSLCLATGKARY